MNELKNLAMYPLWSKWLGLNNQVHSPSFSKKMEALDEALGSWNIAMSAGQVENARLVESKEVISRALESAWSHIPRDNDYLKTLPDAQWNALDSLPAPNLSNIDGRLRRVLATPDHPLRTALSEFLKEMLPLSSQYAFLRANAVKRRPKTEEEKAMEFAPPPSSSKAVAQVRQHLEAAIERTYGGLLERRRAYNQQCVKSYQAGVSKILEPLQLEDGGNAISALELRNVDRQLRALELRWADVVPHVLKRQLKKVVRTTLNLFEETEETQRLSDALAEKDARLFKELFLVKNLKKLTPILEAKGEEAFDRIEEVGEISLEGREGEFSLHFKDGSSFRIRNAVVFVTNQHGHQFARFPSTFHDVKLPGGVIMPGPSEERMHQVFVRAPSSGSSLPRP